MASSVIFIAFANDQDNYLPLINRERKYLTRTLRPLEDKGLIRARIEPGTSIEDIFEIFNTYNNQISIFHYGGHADGTHLQLETTDAKTQNAYAKGLAELLGRQKNLQLVFLNGCATKAQVDLLFKSGVKTVIATRVKIDDEMATEFSEQFYQALANLSSVEESFDKAKDYINTKYDFKDGNIKKYRSIGSQLVEDNKEIPWGLYINDREDSALSWTIASTPAPTIDGQVNDNLIDEVCEELSKYNRILDEELNKNEDEFDIPSIRREIVDSYPTPIGENLRKLFSCSNDPSQPDHMELYGLARLEQIAQTYHTGTQLICYTLLAQLWDEKFKNPENFILDKSHLVKLKELFELNWNNCYQFNYFDAIQSLAELFKKNKVQYFIEEMQYLNKNSVNKKDLFESFNYLHNIYREVNTPGHFMEDVAEKCISAEIHLGIVLREFAFLTKYKLSTVKNIEIQKNRHEVPRFRHNQILLKKAITVASTGVEETSLEFNNYTDNSSVLFLKTKDQEIEAFLNLTPFVLDLCALRPEYKNPMLYFYNCFEQEHYHFQFLGNPKKDHLSVSKSQFPKIKKQMDRFKFDVLGITFENAKTATREAKSRFKRKR